jgi:hypothetical protein
MDSSIRMEIGSIAEETTARHVLRGLSSTSTARNSTGPRRCNSRRPPFPRSEREKEESKAKGRPEQASAWRVIDARAVERLELESQMARTRLELPSRTAREVHGTWKLLRSYRGSNSLGLAAAGQFWAVVAQGWRRCGNGGALPGSLRCFKVQTGSRVGTVLPLLGPCHPMHRAIEVGAVSSSSSPGHLRAALQLSFKRHFLAASWRLLEERIIISPYMVPACLSG